MEVKRDEFEDALADIGLDRETFTQMSCYVGQTAVGLASQQYGLALAIQTDAFARVFASHSHALGWTDAAVAEELDAVLLTLQKNVGQLREFLKHRNDKPN